MPDLGELVAKANKTKENLSETTIFVFNFFNFFNFFNYLGAPSLGGLWEMDYWLSEVGPDSYVVPLPDRGGGPQNSLKS